MPWYRVGTGWDHRRFRRELWGGYTGRRRRVTELVSGGPGCVHEIETRDEGTRQYHPGLRDKEPKLVDQLWRAGQQGDQAAQAALADLAEEHGLPGLARYIRGALLVRPPVRKKRKRAA